MSQLVNEREWRNSRIYSESRHPLGCDDQCTVVLGSDLRDFSALSIGRARQVFQRTRDSDRQLDSSASEISRRTRKAITCLLFSHSNSAVASRSNDRDSAASFKFGDCRFTPRETEVLYALLDGKSARNAAHQLGISPRTYSTHLNTIYRKLGATCRSEALAAAFQRRCNAVVVG